MEKVGRELDLPSVGQEAHFKSRAGLLPRELLVSVLFQLSDSEAEMGKDGVTL